MIALVCVAWGAPSSSGSAHATLGARLDADGQGVGATVGQAWVVGGDGRTAATRVSARWAAERWVFAAHLPFATYAVHGPAGTRQRTGLGNLRLDAFHRREGARELQLVGVQVHLPVGDAYTWTHGATEIWPGGGVTAVYQRRDPVGPVQLLFRGSVGVHGTGGFAPLPQVFGHGAVVAGVELPLPAGLGLLGEASLAWWDTSPADLSGWVQAQPGWAPGLRARAGLTLPLGTWAGLAPTRRPAGTREATLLLDLSAAY